MPANLTDLSLLKQRGIEQLFAASLFVRPSETVQTCGWLDPQCLTNEQIRRYWNLARERVTPVMDDHQAQEASVAAAMESDMLPLVMQWSGDLPYMDVPEAYAAEITRRRYLTDTSILAGKLIAAIQSQDDEQAAAVIRELAGLQGGKRAGLPGLSEIATRFEQAVITGQRSIETFLPGIDSATGGLERQTLSIVAARPSMGKTAILLQIARNAAQAGKQVDFYSMEMSSVSLWARAACPTVGVTWRDVRAGTLSQDKRTALIQASYDLADQYGDRLHLIETPQTTESLWRAVAERRPDLVIADHLRLFRDKGDSEVKRLGTITERLKEIAKSFDCASLLAVQLNRSVESRTNNRPMLSDMRDSGEIEENADLVLMMYRPDYYNPDQTMPKSGQSATEVWIRKFRDGPANVLINLMFDPRQEWFEPAERRQL